MKPRIYLETTVVSYYVSRPSRDLVIAGHQEATRVFWESLDDQFEPYVSGLVLREAGKGDADQAHARLEALKGYPVLDIDDRAELLARILIDSKAIPKEYPEDALHVAVAAVNGMEIIATWNFAHLNNPFIRKSVRRAVESEGYVCPEIASPDEIIGGDE